MSLIAKIYDTRLAPYWQHFNNKFIVNINEICHFIVIAICDFGFFLVLLRIRLHYFIDKNCLLNYWLKVIITVAFVLIVLGFPFLSLGLCLLLIIEVAIAPWFLIILIILVVFTSEHVGNGSTRYGFWREN